MMIKKINDQIIKRILKLIESSDIVRLLSTEGESIVIETNIKYSKISEHQLALNIRNRTHNDTVILSLDDILTREYIIEAIQLPNDITMINKDWVIFNESSLIKDNFRE